MINLRKKALVISIVIGVLASASSSFSVNRAIWVEGAVTRAPWSVGTEIMIEVDWKPYLLPPGVRITHRYWRNNGAYDEKLDTVSSIFTGQKILIKVWEKEIVQIVLL
ncbi:MAG: hypothetical protein V1793_11045 [Pseudomonadota bacterium]